MIADDFLFTLPDGAMLDRPQFLAWTAGPASIRDVHVENLTVCVLEDGLAIAHGACVSALGDGARAAGQYTIVWARRDGRWMGVGAYVIQN
jgi:hypothetical protein